MKTNRMPRIKSSAERLKIIDKLLAGTKIIESRDALLEMVNQEIYPEAIGLEMLDKDLRELRDLADTEDVNIKWTRTRGYHYSVPGYRYFQKALTDDDKVLLVLAQNLFQTFRQTTLKEKFRELVEKVIENDGSARFWENIRSQKFIQPEWENESPGNRWLPTLITAIHEKKQIQVHYAKEKKNLSPYVLKQNKGLWYLVAYDHEKKGDEAIKIYSLNRINQVLPGQLTYYKDPTFKPEEYFRYSLGIWHRHGSDPLEVELEFLHPRVIDHLLQNKLHPTQKVIKQSEKSLRISISVYDSIELENLILGFGDDVRLISPKSLKTRIKNRIATLQQMYK